ncbi:DUF6468 domain-containing protein [Pseudogemmobacter faecipullorum]|uniref:DUF2730 family protein n=1 Tax=Pseudogemmobacter faecipullorum TaxID=2755041 RepID=A0ABS8CK62_9RHOB|nr:hypothetical protein [Pseudogemmobacter faecipullorum]MCB5409558.1 hypothetical protein [Pseudogemmobacter faecipullorum]
MDLIADSLLLAATLGAVLYCYVLAQRLQRFTALETGMGGAIAVLSAEVDEMTRALEKAQGVAGQSERRLGSLTDRADHLATRLELLVAALHDLPSEVPARPQEHEPVPAGVLRLRQVRREARRQQDAGLAEGRG